MIDLKNRTIADYLRASSSAIAEQALARGWQVFAYRRNSMLMRLIRPDGKVLEVYSASPPTMSYAAAFRADDKYATHALLEDNNLPVLPTWVITARDDVQQMAEQALAEAKTLVVKPLNDGHGRGVTVGLSDVQKVIEAIDFAREFRPSVVAQAYVHQPVDVRIVCINYKFQAALQRMPARVKGDGTHTVAELIVAENQRPERGLAYRTLLNKIDANLARRFLGEDGLNQVVPEGEWRQVLGTANVGTGGETLDITDVVPEWLVALAEHTSKVAELPVCGVDFLLQAVPTPGASQETLQPVIIELNKCPSFFIHEPPVNGKSRPLTAAYLDYLETL